MEVRAERKNRKFANDSHRKHGFILRIILSLTAICLLAGGLMWKFGQKTTLAAGYNMEKGSDGRYVFNVVEVVPAKEQAVLGNLIGGFENIPSDKLLAFSQRGGINDWYYKRSDYSKLFYWKDESKHTEKAASEGKEPFTLILENGKPIKIINNEIFKLYMMGIGQRGNGTIYQSYQDNQEKLIEFDKQYVLKYQVMTPEEFEKTDKTYINYLQIGGGVQLDGAYDSVYKTAMGSSVPWYDTFTTSDISWKTALELYEKAISKDKRMSVSISSYCMSTLGSQGKTKNLYKLYVMLNFFDDPSVFSQLYKDGNVIGSLVKSKDNPQYYIDKTDGTVHYRAWDGAPNDSSSSSWELLEREFWNYLPTHYTAPRAELNYIPKTHDNILLYNSVSFFFSEWVNQGEVKKILDFTDNTGEPAEDDEEAAVRVLEIEPCNSYWLSDPKNLSRLAIAIGEDEDDISVTYVTPNRLNGMTADLVAEYDLIYIGEDVSQFGTATDISKFRYSNNGRDGDLVIPQTLVNGLLESDYTFKSEFEKLVSPKTLITAPYLLEGSGSELWNPGLRKIWKTKPGQYFLKNVEQYLKLGKADLLSKARFSGNDLNRYMQKQLAEFVLSGQPVILNNWIDIAVEDQYRSFSDDRANKNPPAENRSEQDSRLYFALKGIADERLYYDNNKALPVVNTTNIIMSSVVELAEKACVSVNRDLKPSVSVSNINSLQPTILKKGGEDSKLDDLVKSGILSFNYEITLPRGEKDAKNCVMTVVVDRNGDGVFDRAGDGTTKTAAGYGTQNNATDTIKNDKVYNCEVSALAVDGDGKITGTFVAPEAVEGLEEFYEFQVIISTKDKNNARRGVWTGYMRPEVKTPEAEEFTRVLQITPYSGSQEYRGLAGNTQFTDLVKSLGDGREFKFKFDSDEYFKVMSVYDFSDSCENKTITAESLKKFDLIIAGTDFNSPDRKTKTDIDSQEAAKVLQTYIDTYKKPVIFTNDAVSYVNSANYVTPIQGDGNYRYLTIGEAEELGNRLVEGDKYKKVQIARTEYENFERLNERYLANNWKGEGTIYLEPLINGSFESGKFDKQGFFALMRPVSGVNREPVKEVFVGYEGSDMTSRLEVKGTNTSGTVESVLLSPTQLNDIYNQFNGTPFNQKPVIYEKKVEGQVQGKFYYTKLAYITTDEALKWYTNNNNVNQLKTVTVNAVNAKGESGTYVIKIHDIHSMFQLYNSIPSGNKNGWEWIDNVHYYAMKDAPNYLALKGDDNMALGEYGYAWQIKDDGYSLKDVSGTASSLYPDRTPWNYYTTQSLRYILGMDRFAVTTDIDKEKKRDPGSSRRYNTVKELQGFTNGALLEYAYLAPPGSSWTAAASAFSRSIYKDSDLALGTKPRTDTAERFNDGIISHYPFEIGNADNRSDLTFPINQNHAPFYQLDSDRELGEGKIDDVTVWYTLAGTADTQNPEKVKASKYFDVTRRDAGNNYYLYSKGKAYYTGFSLQDSGKTADTEVTVPEKEMQLFINTIYAALNSKSTLENELYEAVVNPIGTVSNISRSTVPGTNNQYVCYFDEFDENVTFQFRIQKPLAAAGETTPVLIGFKKPGEVLSLEPVLTDQECGLSPGITELFPVEIAPEQGGAEAPTDSGKWYSLSLPPAALDGKTLVIAVAVKDMAGGKLINETAIHAEIRLVKRDSFELD